LASRGRRGIRGLDNELERATVAQPYHREVPHVTGGYATDAESFQALPHPMKGAMTRRILELIAELDTEGLL
jgi:hypothetical protein